MFSLHLTDMKIRRNGVLVSVPFQGNFSWRGQMVSHLTADLLLSPYKPQLSAPYISIGNTIGSALRTITVIAGAGHTGSRVLRNSVIDERYVLLDEIRRCCA